MTKPKTKTTSPDAVQIYPIRMIPLNLLDVDEANVRQIKNGVTIDMLADDIAHRSLIQSLNVRTTNDADGNSTGRFGVKAGGRRLKALQILVKRKHIEPDQAIPCIVKDDGNATDDSLAENVFREQLHPLDQFRAFKDLAEQGIPDASIAKRYHVTERFVQQRLKLAKASPKLLKAFQDEEISLEQLQAFCVTDDHKRQDSILKLIKGGQRYGAYDIKKTLTENSIEADDPRARFVGLETYTAAGGTLTQDLFKEESGPWLQDPVLLDQLAIAKLEAVRDDILAKGYPMARVRAFSAPALRGEGAGNWRSGLWRAGTWPLQRSAVCRESRGVSQSPSLFWLPREAQRTPRLLVISRHGRADHPLPE